MQKSFHADKPSDIVLTGIGMISASGRNYAANRAAFDQPTTRHSHSDYQVLNFNPAPYLTDRKVVKSVSSRDVLGLVAFEECIKEAGVHPSANAVMNPERVGLYVGAPPSATTDNANYQEAIAQSSTSAGKLVEADFGLNFRSANPTTLLAGLPNNVLCYGAKTLDARGPNSNYTALEVSGHLAVIGAVRAMRLGRLDCAVAGGYSAHTDSVMLMSLRRRGLLKRSQSGDNFFVEPFADEDLSGTITADGAAFLAMETREHLRQRGREGAGFATLMASGMASDARWPFAVATSFSGEGSSSIEVLAQLIRKTLAKAGVETADVGILALSGLGISWMDSVELSAVRSVFQRTGQESLPSLICTSRIWGNLMEAGGIADVGLMAHCFANGDFPAALKVKVELVQKPLSEHTKKIGVVLRCSAWGEFTCLVLNYFGEPQGGHQ